MTTARTEPNYRLQRARQEKGITQGAAARGMGIHVQTYALLERGKQPGTLALAQQVATYYDLPTDYLFPSRLPSATGPTAEETTPHV
jgi:transcriptional regulator with XRE-family HTH domain